VSPGLSYAVIRCHAMRAELLNPAVFKTLVEAKTYEEYMDVLNTTSYATGSDTRPRTALELEGFLNQVFIARLQRIVSFSPQRIAEFLRIFFLMRLEIQNLMRIVRLRFSPDSGWTRTLALIPVEPLFSIPYGRLLEQGTIEGFVEALEPTIYKDVKNGLNMAKQHDALWPLEVYLNSAFHVRASGVISGLDSSDRVIVREILKTETDVENVLAALSWRRKLRDRLPPPDFFPYAYRVTPMQLIELIEGASLADITKTVNQVYIRILEPMVELDDVSLVRRNLRQYVYEYAERCRTQDDFGFPCIFSLLVSFETEKDALVALGWGKEQRISTEKLLRYTVLPSVLG